MPRLVHRLAVVALAAVMGLAVLPATAAQANTWRSASSTGFGSTTYAGQAAATANARAELNLLAASLGETCTSVTVSPPKLVYTAPDGSAYIYQATATGYCAPAVPVSASAHTN